MFCKCGTDLGKVTLKTIGVCDNCGRSKWRQVAEKIIPKSQAIANSLNIRFQRVCLHDRNPCISVCGVAMEVDDWMPITQEYRKDWFERVERLGNVIGETSLESMYSR